MLSVVNKIINFRDDNLILSTKVGLNDFGTGM